MERSEKIPLEDRLAYIKKEGPVALQAEKEWYKNRATELKTNEKTIDTALAFLRIPKYASSVPTLQILDQWAGDLTKKKDAITRLKALLNTARAVGIKKVQEDIAESQKLIAELPKAAEELDRDGLNMSDNMPAVMLQHMMPLIMNAAISNTKERERQLPIQKEMLPLCTRRINFMMDLATNREEIIDRSIVKVEKLRAYRLGTQ
ncbi:uncharacterized protein EHS24_007619 [Apiotrichum porosum]|uniref:Uncharacterized protein n=1 Tax=Apiotrichum porosum TaxID=105984 RepID=A0A427XUV1_9TREE|nr:uncharacterized protein EHS24_007619 [Apiotrichum porosum]RSH82630.1 hypothetical protein EHS24_007619 [Apiotrichum porosum]